MSFFSYIEFIYCRPGGTHIGRVVGAVPGAVPPAIFFSVGPITVQHCITNLRPAGVIPHRELEPWLEHFSSSN